MLRARALSLIGIGDTRDHLNDAQAALERSDMHGAMHDLRLAVDASEAALSLVVKAMREQGITWAAIGKTLGVTRQAAEQRFGTNTPEVPTKS